ncbi:putative exporter [Paraburkholderia sp. BL8N3]|nr:MMPL family transporter [Paraburkholderia sp. BL8N3]TCK44399.1 putative exporter [Paraburkholderia sp. BL8N3]
MLYEARVSVRSTWAVRLAWLLLALAAGAYCAMRFAGPSPLQTNLLALLPPTEADPVAERAVDSLASAMGDRTVFLVTGNDPEKTRAAARAFGTSLAQSGALRNVLAELPPFDLSQIARLYAPHRFGLLSADDRASLASGADLSDALARRLYAPMRGGLATGLADDPFGWLEHFLGTLPLSAGNLDLEDNMLVMHRGASTSVLVNATLPASAYESATQHAVRDVVARAEGELQRSYPGVTLARTGAVFYADVARQSAEREVHVIGAVSAVGIALLMLWVFRSPRLIVLGFASTAIGIVCALAATLLVFGKLHLLTLVFGASLIGEAVDYSIQYFVVYLSAGRRWHARRGARAVRPALTVALATSLFGYAILAGVPFPALRQIACFAIVGIGAAFASVLWLLPALLVEPAKRAPARLFQRAGRLLARWSAALHGRRAMIVAVLVVAVSVPGWLRATSDDDVHLLIQRDASLVSQEDAIRQATGFDGGSQFFVVKGANDEAVLERTEALVARLDAFVADGRLKGAQAVTSFVPSARTQAENRALLDRHVFADPDALRALMSKAGFRDEVAGAYLAAHARDTRPLTIDDWLRAPISQPYRHLWLGNVQPGVSAAVVLPTGAAERALPALASLAATLPGVTFVDKAGSVSKLFGAYRFDASLWLAGALVVVFASLAWQYGLRGAVATAAPVALAVGAALAGFGYANVPLNLFNWLALMLVLGVGSNYAVFLREGCAREGAQLGAVWTGVLLSAATTLLSFGMLALSSMPALASFGATLAAGIAVAVVLAPMGLNATRRPLDASPEETR